MYGGAREGDVISTYTYGDSNWKDLLTAYNGKTITYDEIGNPLTYYNGMQFTWTMGRRLESATSSGGTKITYTYNADGLRTGKNVNGIQYDYYWNGDKLTYQTDGANTWYFRYDGDTPIGLEFNGVEYYYVTNLQGDIIAILNDSGECVAEYEYDAWGNYTITKDTDTIAIDNPLRYRGYYYDAHLKLYYLQSRFYDANTGRFINADEPEMILDDIYNLFSYCESNPIMSVDKTGKAWYSSIWNGIKSFFGIKKKVNKFKTLAGIMTTCKNVSEVRLEHIKNIFNYGSGQYKKLSSKLKYKNEDKYIKKDITLV